MTETDLRQRITELEKAIEIQTQINTGQLPASGYLILTTEAVQMMEKKTIQCEQDRCLQIVESEYDHYPSNDYAPPDMNSALDRIKVKISTNPPERQDRIEQLEMKVRELEQIIWDATRQTDWYYGTLTEHPLKDIHSLPERVKWLVSRLERLENP